MTSRIIIGALFAALISGAGLWVAWARTVPTTAEVKELIQTQSPYLEDRKVLVEQGERIEKLEDHVLVILQEIAEANAALRFLIRQSEDEE